MAKEEERTWTDIKYFLYVTRMGEVDDEAVSGYIKAIGEHVKKRYTEDSSFTDFLFDLRFYRRRQRFSVICAIVTDKLSDDMTAWINCTPVTLYYGYPSIRPWSYHKDYFLQVMPVIYTSQDSMVHYDRISPDKELERIVKDAFVPKIGEIKHVTKSQMRKGRRNDAYLRKKGKAAQYTILWGVFLPMLGFLSSFISSELLIIFLGGGSIFIIGGIMGIIEARMAEPEASAKR